MPDKALIDRARIIVTDPAAVNCEPALMADAFLTLAEARGMTTRFANLGAAHHRIGPATEMTEAPMAENVTPLTSILDAACARTRDKVRAMAPTGGDAA